MDISVIIIVLITMFTIFLGVLMIINLIEEDNEIIKDIIKKQDCLKWKYPIEQSIKDIQNEDN